MATTAECPILITMATAAECPQSTYGDIARPGCVMSTQCAMCNVQRAHLACNAHRVSLLPIVHTHRQASTLPSQHAPRPANVGVAHPVCTLLVHHHEVPHTPSILVTQVFHAWCVGNVRKESLQHCKLRATSRYTRGACRTLHAFKLWVRCGSLATTASRIHLPILRKSTLQWTPFFATRLLTQNQWRVQVRPCVQVFGHVRVTHLSKERLQ